MSEPLWPRAVEQPVAQPGWHADPWGAAPWRWWDGRSWTAVTSAGAASAAGANKPRLPGWLSVPVIVCGALTIPILALVTFAAPLAIVLGIVPLFIVGPVLWWIDRVEPEPISSRVHAFLWGAAVAGFISSVVNTLVAWPLGFGVAAVVSAPLIEEVTKGLAIVWAVRRNEVDSVMDGIVYAGWSALGFAVIEDFTYLAQAEDAIIAVFIGRVVFTPFAHPLFTAWIGLAIGRAVTRGKPISSAWWGLAVAIGLHALWNGSLTLAAATENNLIIAVAALTFVAIFGTGMAMLVVVRRNEQDHFVQSIPFLAGRYQLPSEEVAVFGNWSNLLRLRRALPNKAQKKHFDAMHTALARLAALHRYPEAVDPLTEERLASQLQLARQGQRRP